MSAEEAIVVAATDHPGLDVEELAARAGVTYRDVLRALRRGLVIRVQMGDRNRYYLPEAGATLPKEAR